MSTPNLRVLPWAGFAAALSYTFDDTQPSQIEHWKALKGTGVKMTFFANPSANWQQGFDATWSSVAAAGSEIGNHTWSHCHANLTDCTPVGTAEDEIDKATEYIKTHFGVPRVYSFAAPFGDTGWNATASSRFLLGRGVASGSVPATGVNDWYNLPVFAVTAGQTALQFNAAIDETQRNGRWTIFLFHSILPTANNWYAGVQIAEILTSIAHAKSLGNLWFDTMGAVGAYLRAQRMLEALVANDNTWTWTLPSHFPPARVLRVTVDGGTLIQKDVPLTWDPHGYYEVSLDAGELRWTP
ncbi:MAG: polysaccharide deacetylase family protein [Anaeromyxobacter sp.]